MLATLLPLAHAGHWAPDLAIFLGPVVLGIAAVRFVDRRERRREAEEAAAE